MKRALYTLIGVFCFQSISFAQNDKEVKDDFISGSIITSFNQEIIEYKFKSLDDMNLGIDEIVNEFELASAEKKKNKEDNVLFEVKVELLANFEKTVISKSITTGRTNEALVMVIKRFKTLLSLIVPG